jgi:hypothetical protein
MPETSPITWQSIREPAPIVATAVYDEALLHCNFGLPYASLAKARRDGSLRHVVVGKRILFLGSWLLDWFESTSVMAPAKEGGQ